MLSYIVSALVATTAIATFEEPAYSGQRLSYAKGGADWEGNCANSAVDQNQSPIDISKTTKAGEMSMHIEGLEDWGKVYQAKSPLDGRAAAGPDYSFQTLVAAVPAPDAEANDWADLTSVHLNAPLPIGEKTF